MNIVKSELDILAHRKVRFSAVLTREPDDAQRPESVEGELPAGRVAEQPGQRQRGDGAQVRAGVREGAHPAYLSRNVTLISF